MLEQAPEEDLVESVIAEVTGEADAEAPAESAAPAEDETPAKEPAEVVEDKENKD